MGKTLVTPKFRAAFVNIDKPRVHEEGDDPKYELVMIFDAEAQDTDEFRAMEAAIEEVIAETWPKSKPKTLRRPFKDASEFENGDGERYKGFEDDDLIAVRASHTDQPGRKDRDPSVNLEDGEFYSGCYGRAAIDAFTFNMKTSKGATFGLGHVQKLGDGDKLGGQRPSAVDVFGSEVQPDCTTVPDDSDDEDVPF